MFLRQLRRRLFGGPRSLPTARCLFDVACTTDVLPALSAVVSANGVLRGYPQAVVNGKLAPADLDVPLQVGRTYRVMSEQQAVFLVDVMGRGGTALPVEQVWPQWRLTPELAALWRQAPVTVRIVLVREAGRPGEAVLFVTRLAERLAELTDGCVFDGFAERYFGPGGWQAEQRLKRVDCREHVSLHVVGEGDGDRWLHTHGLVKFGHPEFEVYRVPGDAVKHVSGFLLDLMQYVVDGALVRPGHTLGTREAPIAAVAGRKERAHWGSVPVLELVDVERGRPVAGGAMRGIAASR